MANLKSEARKLKRAGRYGDTQLVHMSMDEYMALQAMGKLTKNPDTGLPEAFNLGGYFNDLVNPFGMAHEGTLGADIAQIGRDMPGSPMSLGAAIDRGEWSNPFSEGQNSFDIFAGGSAQSEDPTMRKIGRTVGSIFAGYGIGSAFGGAGGGAAGGAADAESTALASNIGGASGTGAGAGEAAFAGGAMMPPAQAELASANAAPGGVTSSSGMGNAVTSGAAGTSGAAPFATSSIYNEDFSGDANALQGSQGGEAGPGGPGGATFGAQPMSLFDRIINSAFGTPSATFKTAANTLGMGSEIYNLIQQRKMQKMARQAFTSTKELQANPSMITSLPGYQFGLDEGRRAIERRGAASGSGGNEAIALARYTPEYAQQFYDREFARRANLDQAQAQLDLNANTAASRGNAQSIGNIGFALARMFG